ncbi:MAG: hypothetical protein JNL80_16740 [Phycisphaerae bacterium]|nr:hypothetical protein [Phycisphaerae bacterium]
MLFALIIVGGGYVLTRPALLQSLLQPALTKAIGGEVTLQDIRLEGFSTLYVRHMTVRAPGWPGEAAEVISADDIRVSVSLTALLTGSVDVRSLQFGVLRVRCAERDDAPGEFNLLALGSEGRSDEDHLRPVRVDLGRLDIETGLVSRDGVWTRVGERSLRGFLSPSPDRMDGTLFSFRLADIPPTREAGAPTDTEELSITGTWDERTFAIAASLDAITLDDRVLALLPLGAQRSARTLGLTGKIRGAKVGWSPKAPLFAELSVADMSVTLPEGLDLDDDWSRFRNGKREPREGLPTVHVRDGTVRLEGSKITLHRLTGELASSIAPTATQAPSGTVSATNTRSGPPIELPAPPETAPGVVPVPIELGLELSLADLPIGTIDWNDAEARRLWIEETLKVAPFSLTVAIRGFDSSKAAKGYDPVLEVPSPIAAALETFGVTSWRLDVEAEFSRAESTVGPDQRRVPAPIRSKGQCFLSGGRGSYEAFPYEISDVRAHLAFDQDDAGDDRLVVDYISGTTEAGSTITMKGTVTRLGPEAIADITVTAPKFTIDSRLIDLFERGNHTSIACLFHQPSIDGLLASGVLKTDDLPALIERQKALQASLAATSDAEERERLALESARVERMIDVRPYAMGGTGALNVRLVRTPGETPPVSISGSVTIERAGVLIDEFPYPLVVTSGTISIAPSSIRFGEEGLRAITLEGGLVRIGGEIAIVPRERTGAPGQSSDSVRGRPNLTITAAGDRINPLLLAAIPPDRGEVINGWPGAALVSTARLLDATGIRGTIDLHGTISEEAPPPGVPLGRKMPTHTHLQIEVSDGALDSKEAHDVPQSLPAGISLRELEASVIIDRDVVEFRSLKAADASGTGTVVASGRFNTGDESESVDLRLENMPIAPWLAEAMPDGAVESAREWWTHWKPRGFFDAHVTVSSTSEGGTMTTIEARPREITVAPFGREVSVRGLDGSISIIANDHGTHGATNALRLTDGLEAEAGTIMLDGTLAASGASLQTLDLTAKAESMRFESPLAELLLRWSGAQELADAIAARAPTGRTDGTLTFHTTAGTRPEWSLQLLPSTLALSITSGAVTGRPAIRFDPGSTFEADAKGATFRHMRGQFDGGRIALDGSVDLSTTPHTAAGSYSLEATSWSDSASALLPPPLNIARDRIQLKAEAMNLPAAAITLQWDPDRGIGSPLLYTIDGLLSLRGSQMTTGVPFTELEGEVDYGFRYETDPDGSNERTSLTAAVTLPTCRIYDRLLTNGSTRITLVDPPSPPPTSHNPLATVPAIPPGQQLLIRDISGTLADGRVIGQATVDLNNQRYATDIRVIGASLAPLIAPRDPESASGGAVDGRISLEGSTAEVPAATERRTGRGRISIRDAAMAKSPITLRLLQLSQLALPLSSALKTGDIQFFIDGDTATFDRFELTTSGLILDGSGTMDTRDFSVDLAFRSRGRLGILSEIVGTVSDQLYEITVTGPLNDPVASLRALPGLLRKGTPDASGTK